MSFFSAIPTPETTIGIAVETERGTAVAPSYYIPVMGPKYEPDVTWLPDEGLRGSMVQIYDEIPGLRYDAHAWDQYLYLDSFPLMLMGELGSSDTVTAAPSSTTLADAAVAGATTITTAAAVAAGSYIVLSNGSPSTIETHYVASVSGDVLTLAFPLIYNQPEGATVTGLTKHQFSLLNNDPTGGNQPPSFTITDFGGETNWRQLTAAQLDNLTVSGSAESLPKAALTWFANASETPSAPSADFTTAEAPPGWTAQLIIGGTQVGYVIDWEVAMSRKVKPVPAITGSQAYWQYFASTFAPTSKITVLEDPSATWLTAYEDGTTESFDLTLYDTQNGWAVNFHSSKVKFTKGSLDRSKEWTEVPLEMQMLPTTDDALAGGVSPMICTIANAVTEAY